MTRQIISKRGVEQWSLRTIINRVDILQGRVDIGRGLVDVEAAKRRVSANIVVAVGYITLSW